MSLKDLSAAAQAGAPMESAVGARVLGNVAARSAEDLPTWAERHGIEIPKREQEREHDHQNR
jgi:hypothetical protein